MKLSSLDSSDDSAILRSTAADRRWTPDEGGGVCDIHDFGGVRWAWATRHVFAEALEGHFSLILEKSPPRVADLAMVQVERIGHHHHLETAQERRFRLYEGDRLIGIFGNRYATDVYEGRVLDLKKLHLLTASGIVGTVLSRHQDVGRPTSLSFVGYLGDSSGTRLNLKQLRFPGATKAGPSPAVILVVGTGMSTGKTTVTRKLLRALTARGLRAAGCKLTGSASPRDLYEMRATGAVFATDFSEYGLPSTWGESLADLIRVMDAMSAECARAGAELVVMELADGFLQPETEMLLESDEIRRRVRGVVVAGACSSSLLLATESLERRGLEVWAASGLVTNSPLFLREFTARSPVPVASSRGNASRLARIVSSKMKLQNLEERQVQAAAPAD